MKYVLSIISLLLVIACSHSDTSDMKIQDFVAYDGTDTIMIDLIIADKKFQGNYYLKGMGNYKIQGEISGDVKGDTLLGSLYYLPYKWKDKKRKAFALLKTETGYVSGFGKETLYMGIPYFDKETLVFDNLVFHPFEKLVK